MRGGACNKESLLLANTLVKVVKIIHIFAHKILCSQNQLIQIRRLG
jgi:hypothetical protein